MIGRIFGLDLLRATAIILVLVNHSINYFITFPGLTVWGDICGILGVELFFVLSGFLIGQIIFKNFQRSLSQHTIKKFYLRRWLRTLPLYYILLVFFVLLALFVTKQPHFSFLHFIFLQNFSPDALRFFSVTWSLAIEEWFYLLLPLVLFFGYKQKFFSSRMLLFLSTLIMSIIVVRLFYVVLFNPSFEEIHKHLFFRFDSLLIGVLLAGLKLKKQSWYKELQRSSHIIIPLFFIAVTCYSYEKYEARDALDISLAVRVIGFPLVSFFIALLIPFLEANRFINGFLAKIKIVGKTILWTSILSYSVYLIHLSVFDVVKGTLLGKVPELVLLLIALTLTFMCSYILYRCIEQPFLRLREKFS